jgi:hypothetical protein
MGFIVVIAAAVSVTVFIEDYLDPYSVVLFAPTLGSSHWGCHNRDYLIEVLLLTSISSYFTYIPDIARGYSSAR